jgi:hypothetical protein
MPPELLRGAAAPDSWRTDPSAASSAPQATPTASAATSATTAIHRVEILFVFIETSSAWHKAGTRE